MNLFFLTFGIISFLTVSGIMSSNLISNRDYYCKSHAAIRAVAYCRDYCHNSFARFFRKKECGSHTVPSYLLASLDGIQTAGAAHDKMGEIYGLAMIPACKKMYRDEVSKCISN